MPTNYVMAAWCYILSGKSLSIEIKNIDVGEGHTLTFVERHKLKLLTGLLDAVDGHAARLLGQSSKFGAMLDMLTDRWFFFSSISWCIRCATMCLLTTLSTFYPSFMFLFQVSRVEHWI